MIRRCDNNRYFWILSGLSVLVGLQVQAGLAVEYNVYILTGQSNSLGTTAQEVAAGPGTDPADDETLFFWSNVQSSNTVYPPVLYGDSGGSLVSLQPQQGDGNNPTFWGPEFGLARRLHEAGHSNVLIIKASRGGGGNTYWDQSSFNVNDDSGHMWGHLRDTLDAGIGTIDEGDTFSVKGLMYLQGESNNSTEAALADTRMISLIDNVKAHINASYPNTTDDLHAVIGEIAASSSNANRAQTTQLQEALTAANSDISFVQTSDLPLKSDGIHFGRDAKLEIGKRFADVLIAFSEVPNDLLGDVNQDGIISTGSGDVENDDVAAFLNGWRSTTLGLTNLERTQRGDLDLNGITDLVDALILQNALEAQGLAFPFEALTKVPEVNSLWLLFISFFSLIHVRMRVSS